MPLEKFYETYFPFWGVLSETDKRLLCENTEEKHFDRSQPVHDNMGCTGLFIVRSGRESVSSFINNDEALADEVIELDDQMDDMFLAVKTDLIELIKKDGTNGDQAIELMMVAKYLERIGDHAVNVAEWTKYNETGVHQKF